MGDAMNDAFENRAYVEPEHFPGETAQARQRKLNQKDNFMNDLNPSRKPAARTWSGGLLALFLLTGLPAINVTEAAGLAATNTPAAIPWNQIGAKAGADYQGDGLAVTPIGSGARLHCVFQRLDGESTPEGLWLTSTVTNTVSDRFRVTAAAVGRVTPCAPGVADTTSNIQHPASNIKLEDAGIISLAGQTVRLSRPGLTEEYSVSMDGVRQDFIVKQAPLSPPGGELVVKLAVNGAQVEPAADGARLVLAHSGRKIAYSRLRVTDATGKELPARMEVSSVGDEAISLNSWIVGDNQELSLLVPALAKEELAVVVNDADAVYPVRIDPTFSDANWVSMGGFPGVNSGYVSDVYSAVTDGSGNLYIGGQFTAAGEAMANNVAQWNGSSWSALGSGINNTVIALAVSGNTLYAGGEFTTAGGNAANYIAQWNGSSWSPLGSGVNSYVQALAVSGSTLYAGGDFTNAGGSAANYIARWNGSSWRGLGSGMNSAVLALAVSGFTLYAGGSFTTAGGNTANGIARWNGSSWSALGSGMNGYVYALAVSGSTLYAGGYFGTAGGSAANYIAQWNGSSWSALGSGMNGYVYALAVSGSTLYAGGAFTTAGGSAANSIAQWDGSSWSAFGSGMGGEYGVVPYPLVYALAVSGSTLYAGGEFTTAGGSVANDIAQWIGSTWSALGSGLNGYVYALAVSGSTLYVGGDFTAVGGDTNANQIAQWNGSSWSALGSGMNGSWSGGNGDVLALAVSGSTLYAGGGFTTAGGNSATGIAQWNGSSWSALGSGISGPGGDGDGPYVSALAVSGSTLYAGGDFTSAGGIAANCIARWNGSSWRGLGSGMGGQFGGNVSALAVSGSTLYAGGQFTTAGGNAANQIAQWNGTSWSALGSGVNNFVYALAVSGSTLYAGGAFTTAGGNAANGIAQWNGSSWSALGSGLNYGVSALALSGSTLYAGGSGIAQWNGSSWSALGSGLNGGVSALAVSGSTLYAGGSFTTAGTNVSLYAAMANLPGSLAIITTNAAFGFTNGVFGFDVAGPSGANVVIQASTDLQTWIPLQTNLLGSGPLYFSDPQSSANVQRFYRAQLSP